jgi:uncharacterized membrane protein YjgN (DUF898 family)
MDTGNTPAMRTVAVRFSGDTGTYFRIWIVNTALTIVTLGIYSAWAKVRKLRYFYTHTAIEDGHFDFHANPVGILIGRIIAVAMVGAYFGAGYISPLAPFVVIGLILLLVPWLVVRSRIFHLRNTSLHGIRLNFRPNYSGAVRAYYGGVLVTILTLGFGAPTALYWRHRFAVDNSAYGKTVFAFIGEHGEFYAIVWKSIGLVVGGLVAAFAIMYGLGTALPASEEPPSDWVAVLMSLPIFLIYIAAGVYVQVRLRNYIWNMGTLGGNRFISQLSVSTMLKLYLTNMLAIALSLGLLIPWAQIRLARYRAACTELIVVDEWTSFLADARDAGSALGDEIGEAFDVGIDFAV